MNPLEELSAGKLFQSRKLRIHMFVECGIGVFVKFIISYKKGGAKNA